MPKTIAIFYTNAGYIMLCFIFIFLFVNNQIIFSLNKFNWKSAILKDIKSLFIIYLIIKLIDIYLT